MAHCGLGTRSLGDVGDDEDGWVKWEYDGGPGGLIIGGVPEGNEVWNGPAEARAPDCTTIWLTMGAVVRAGCGGCGAAGAVWAMGMGAGDGVVLVGGWEPPVCM